MTAPEFDLDELRTSFREVLAARNDLNAVRSAIWHGACFRPSLWAAMGALGWLGLTVNEAHGGLGLGFGCACVLQEELGRSLASAPTIETLLAVFAIEAGGDARQKALWLAPIAAGERFVTLGLPSAERRSPLPVVSADGTIDGQFDHVPFADVADLIFVPAKTSTDQITLVGLDPADPGLSLVQHPTIDLTRTLATLKLNSAVVVERLALSHADWTELTDRAAVALASDAVGGAQHILERTVAYMETRRQFDRPIGSFQALKHRAAHWKVQLEAAIALTRRAAKAIDRGEGDASTLASEAKVIACNAYDSIAGDAIQLHGGVGFTWEHECHLFLKRAKLNQALYGTARTHMDRAAALLLDVDAPKIAHA